MQISVCHQADELIMTATSRHKHAVKPPGGSAGPGSAGSS
jgi:hypothetical protein